MPSNDYDGAGEPIMRHRPNVAMIATDNQWDMIIMALTQRAETFDRLAREGEGVDADDCAKIADEYGRLAGQIRRAYLAGSHLPAMPDVDDYLDRAATMPLGISAEQAAELDRLDGRR